MTELVTLVDEDDNVIGTKDRQLLSDNDRWRIITIWIANSSGEILIARRAHDKKIEPNLWGPSVAGTVEHPNDYMTTARRELDEELGVQSDNLVFEGTDIFDAAYGKRVCGYVSTAIDKPLEYFTPQREEVAEIRWLSVAELREDYELHPQNYVKNFKRFMDHFIHV